MYDIFQEDVEQRLHLYGLRVNTKKWLRIRVFFYGTVVSDAHAILNSFSPQFNEFRSMSWPSPSSYDEALRGSPLPLLLFQRNVFQERGDIVKAELLEIRPP